MDIAVQIRSMVGTTVLLDIKPALWEMIPVYGGKVPGLSIFSLADFFDGHIVQLPNDCAVVTYQEYYGYDFLLFALR